VISADELQRAQQTELSDEELEGVLGGEGVAGFLEGVGQTLLDPLWLKICGRQDNVVR